MKTENYNLIEEDWIPVLMKDGLHRRVSLGEMFAHGDRIADLSMVAYERISVMRLLICIAMAALDEKDLADEPAWRTCREKIPSAVAAYFAKWHDRFNFYGPHAFMQPDDLTVKKSEDNSRIEKLFPDLASGNNGSFFDHAAVAEDRVVDQWKLPIGMLVLLNFAAGGGCSVCVWGGNPLPSRGVTMGPCREQSMVHTFLCGDNMLENVWLNLITGASISILPMPIRGRPLWEKPSLRHDAFSSADEWNCVLGRLVPLSRVMKFSVGENILPLGAGLSYLKLVETKGCVPEVREFWASVRRSMDGDANPVYSYVSLSASEMPWRNLKALLSLESTGGISLSLAHLDESSKLSYTIWCGGLETNQAKDITALEWRFSFHTSFLMDNMLQSYQFGIDFAERFVVRIERAVQKYIGCVDDSFSKDSESPKPKEALKKVMERYCRCARSSFWDALEKRQPLLVRIVSEDGDMAEWERVVAATAKKAFEIACPHRTGRQIAAYVQALGKLNLKQKEDVQK